MVGESSRNSGNFTLDMSRVAIVERASGVTNVADGKTSSSRSKQLKWTDKFIEQAIIFIKSFGTPRFLIGRAPAYHVLESS